MADRIETQALILEGRTPRSDEPEPAAPSAPPSGSNARHPTALMILAVVSALTLLLGGGAVIYFNTSAQASDAADAADAAKAIERAVAAIPGELSTLVITYNHGEACGDLDARDAAVAEVQAQIKENRPDIVVMMSQEVRKSGRRKPLQEAIHGLGYAWLGSSDIAGYTKMTCHQVDTAVQVAISSKLLPAVKHVAAEHCGASDACRSEDSEKTLYRFYYVKRTKGYVAVHISIKSLGFALRFVGVHLDTKEFDDNLKRYTAPALGKFEKDSPGVTIVAGDFNTRMAKSGYSKLCHHGKLTGERLVKTMDVDSSGLLETLRLSRVEQLLQDGMRKAASAHGLRARLVGPAVGESSGSFFALPTYKYPTGAQAKPEEVASQAKAFFGEEGSEVCKDQKFGVLDSVVAIHDPKKIKVDLPLMGTWRKISGSDHAMISANVLITTGTAVPASRLRAKASHHHAEGSEAQ